MKYIYNAKVVLENGILWDGIVLIDGDRIAAVGARGEIAIPAEAEGIDAGGHYVGPGFVDIHVHGGDGLAFPKEPLRVARYYLKHGTTTILVSPHYKLTGEEYISCFARVRAAMREPGAGKCIAGVYAEGPYVNPLYGSGAKDNKWQDAVRAEDYKPVVDAAGDLVRIWTVAPERKGILAFVQYAREVSPTVRFSVGHSQATPEEIAVLKPYGLNHLTHCMDATGRVSQWAGTRGSGPDEACFLDRDMYCELISDSVGAHVNPALQQLILQSKGLDRVILVTDGSPACYTPPSHLRCYEDLSINEAGELAGSRLTMNKACRNIMTHTNCGIAQAFLLAARNPANAIGLGHEIGTVQAGKRANLVFVDDSFHVIRVMLEGELQGEGESAV